MKTNGAKMTFRFPDRKVDGHNAEDQVHNEEIQAQDSVIWSEYNAFEDMKPAEEEKSFDDVILDQQAYEEHVRVEEWAQDTSKHREEQTPEHVQLQQEKQVLLTTDNTDPHEEWTWTHSPVYEDISPAHTRKRPPAIMKLVGSVIGAIATGLLFAFLALSLIRGEVTMPDVNQTIAAIANTDSSKGGSLPAQAQTGSDGNAAALQENAADAVNNPSAVAVNIGASQAYVLQYGVYAKDEGAQQAITELQKLGLGGVLAPDPDGQRRVFAAVSLEREDAMLLSASLRTKEGSIYVRPFEREAITKLVFTGDADVLNSFMTQSDLVREWLIKQSSKMLQQTTLDAFSVADMDVLRTEHLRWTQWGQQLQKSMDEEHAAQWLKMVQSMNTAISAVNEYNKKTASAHLWNIQQACMQYMVLEQEWLEGMKG